MNVQPALPDTKTIFMSIMFDSAGMVGGVQFYGDDYVPKRRGSSLCLLSANVSR